MYMKVVAFAKEPFLLDSSIYQAFRPNLTSLEYNIIDLLMQNTADGHIQ